MDPQSVLHGRSILVVEDDPLIALYITATLEDVGVSVIGPAAHLSEAIELAQQSRLDAAVLDVRLEVGTSLPLADLLAHRSVPFLFQTSDPSILSGAHPATPVLRKPLRPEQLIKALAALLFKRG